MDLIFGRPTVGHSLQPHLAALEAGPARSIALNWRHDHRIDAPREKHFLGDCLPAASATALENNFKHYHQSQISSPVGTIPLYLDDVNSGNLGPKLPSQLMAHTFSLNNVHVRRALAEADPFYDLIPASDWNRWLDQEIPKIKDTQDFIATILGALNAYMVKPGTPQRPRWLTFSRNISDIVAATDWPDQLRDSLGLDHIRSGEWLILVELPIEACQMPHRPTSFEAGWYWAHFPSPPGYAWGLTMNLNIADKIGSGLPECIDLPCQFPVGLTRCQIGKTTSETTTGQLSIRQKHVERLARDFGKASIDSWITGV